MRCGPLAKYPYQRGSIGLVGGLLLLMALLLTALVVDSGRLWMQQKHLQTVADMAAIHAARHLGCDASQQSVTQMAQQAAVNNGFDGQLSATPNQVLLGKLDTVQGIRQFTADGSRGAVYVRATRVVPSSMVAGGMFGGTVALHAEAVSVSDPSLATFGVGSFTTNLSSQQSVLLNGLLGGMLGGPLSLDALTYRGIAATTVTLQDILAVSGQSGTVEGLLNTNMQIGDLLDLIATAAARNSVADIQAISAIQNIANMTVKTATLKLGDVLAVRTPDANAAATVALNALSMITTAAMIANGVNAITLPLSINVPSLTSVNAQVTIIEPPQLAIGPAAESGGLCTQARTAQLRARVAVLVNIPLLARIDLALGVEVAQGSAGLRSIRHNDGDTEVEIEASPGIAALTLTNIAGTQPARISTLLNIPIADIGLNLPLQPPNPQTMEFTVAHPIENHLPLAQTVTSPLGNSLQNALGQSNVLTISVLSILNLGLVNNVISSIVSPLLAEIGRTLLDPLLNLLGISLGGMDITLDDVQYRQAKPLAI
ncbi:MAG TPA: TadG family pilus assembly protein [Methylophilus sp.]|uniref:TadG family pilus assembly protein n=1 Tax=Methylophilus sp. TaxID=29541 RepID=UPI002C8A1573|nr:TadG family pilus assembly protein [Methylophilus sp.]HSH87174.1 TadG family pilus assembly protein [Methylophilus sp.]